MNFKNLKYFFIAIFVCIVFSSCTGTIGYSVVLWGDEQNQLNDGEIVKVLVKSNITHTYIIEVPKGERNKEIPIWQLSEPESKKKALKTAKKYSEYANTFASVKLDGLPIRADAINTAKQVYRLRRGEVIRILFKGEGAAVNNGKGNMTGEWFRVLTSEGTQGWCFSYNLDIYESENGGKREEIVQEKKEDNLSDDKNMNILRSKRWYPGEYKSLIKNKRIDLQIMSTSYGFTFDEKEGRIVLATIDGEKYWTFKGIRKLSPKQFQFDGANVNVTVKGEDEIVVQYMENGKPKNTVFANFKEDITEIISNEKQRRNKELSTLTGTFSSANYGTITISGKYDDFKFDWKKFDLLVPSIIPNKITSKGSITIDYFIADSLKSSYDGILTFDFNGTKINFLYKMTADGLRLEDAVKATIKDNVVTKRSSSPTIGFFEKK